VLEPALASHLLQEKRAQCGECSSLLSFVNSFRLWPSHRDLVHAFGSQSYPWRSCWYGAQTEAHAHSCSSCTGCQDWCGALLAWSVRQALRQEEDGWSDHQRWRRCGLMLLCIEWNSCRFPGHSLVDLAHQPLFGHAVTHECCVCL